MRKGHLCLALGAAALLVSPPVLAQDHHGGGGGGCGDVFGDLIHVLRDDVTGQPILQKRWVELPKEIPGYGWGYCVIAVDELGEELPFAPLSCDVAEDALLRVVEVDYFGRLNGGRTKERNNRMHFDEVLSSIKTAGLVKEDAAGRLMLGFDCAPNPGGQVKCEEWATVDSPMESFGLYSRLMKYGHLQTHPWEVDEWHHGDPKLPEQYHPALGPEDYAKFHNSVQHLLPSVSDPWACFEDGGIGDDDEPVAANGVWDPTEPYTDLEGEEEEPLNGQYDLGEPFMDINANGVRDNGGDTFAFGPGCTEQEFLDDRDFTRAASFAGAAASKTGKSTRDLVQYVGRILKIAKDTSHTYATPATLPALVRDCPTDPVEPDPDDETQIDPWYDMESCSIYGAHDGLPNYLDFPNVQERFVDFAAAEYYRPDWRDEPLEVIQPAATEGFWEEAGDVPLMGWLGYANGPVTAVPVNIDAFVEGMSDSIRTIQFIHNYEIPEHLWDFTSAAPVVEEKVKDK